MVVLVAAMAMPADAVARRADTAALKAALRESQDAVATQRYSNRLRSVKVPMVADRRVVRGGREDAFAFANSDTGTITSSGAMDALTGAHESAHLLEKVMTDADRGRFAMLMGKPNAPWWHGEPGDPGYRRSLGERFADMTAMAATGFDPQGNQMVSSYIDRPPSRPDLMRFARALERFGRRNGLPVYERPNFQAQ